MCCGTRCNEDPAVLHPSSFFGVDRGKCAHTHKQTDNTSKDLLSQPVNPATSHFLQLTPISRDNPKHRALFMRGRSRACSLAVWVSNPHPHPPNTQSLPLQTVICPFAWLMFTLHAFLSLILQWIHFIGCNVVNTAGDRKKGQEAQTLSHSNYSNLARNTDYKGSLTTTHQRDRQGKTESKTDRREVGVMRAPRQGVQTA